MQPFRRIAARFALATSAILAPIGCASFGPRGGSSAVAENPLIAPSADFESAYNASIRAVDEYFDIATESREARKIVTQPLPGATLIEPWHGDSVDFRERLESSLQTIRRFAIITINPAPGGGQAIKVEVFKELEDLSKPERQNAGRSVFNSEFPVNRTREIVGPVPLPNGWIPRGHDVKLEQVILGRIRDELFL